MQSTLLLGDGRREVRIFFRYPVNEFANIRIFQQARHIHPVTLQFGIGEIGNQRLLANGVHRYDIATSAALGHGMVPDDGLAARPTAEPTRQRRCQRLFFWWDMVVRIMF